MASDAADEQAAWPPADFPTADEVAAANRAIHQQADQPERFRLHTPGFVEHAIEEARAAYAADPGPKGIIHAAAVLAHGIAVRQAFRDGNRRTARSVAQTFLANNGLGHLSPLDKEDHMLARYLNDTVDGGRPVDDFVDLFSRRYENRTPESD